MSTSQKRLFLKRLSNFSHQTTDQSNVGKRVVAERWNTGELCTKVYNHSLDQYSGIIDEQKQNAGTELHRMKTISYSGSSIIKRGT